MHLLLLTVDLLHPHIRHLCGSDLLGTGGGFLPLLGCQVSFNGLVVDANRFVELTRSLVLLNSEEASSEDLDYFLNLVFLVVHGQVEAVAPDFFQLFFAGEVLLSDFKISVNGFGVITGLFPHLGTVQDLRGTLVGLLRPIAQVLVDLVN